MNRRRLQKYHSCRGAGGREDRLRHVRGHNTAPLPSGLDHHSHAPHLPAWHNLTKTTSGAQDF